MMLNSTFEDCFLFPSLCRTICTMVISARRRMGQSVSPSNSSIQNYSVCPVYFIFQIDPIMRNRNKFDWSKPFKFIESKKAFDDLDANDESLIIVINTDEQKEPIPVKKEEIMVPKIDTVKRVTEVKKFAKIAPNYIRLPPHLNLPLASQYELTEVDHIFLKSHQDRFIFRGKRILTQQFLRKAFVELQLKAGRDMILPRSKGWIMAFFQKQNKDLLQMENIESFADLVYNYWKNRREELRFPLLRQLWKPSPDQYNHMLAFRPREREKRSLRRTNRIVEDEIIEELFSEFDTTLKIVDRIQMREELKLNQVSIQLSGFYYDCKSFIGQPDFFEEVKLEDRAKEKEKMKSMHSEIEEYRSRKESLDNIVVQEANGSDIDQKQTIANFLATAVYEAELLGISYEKIYYPNNSLVQEKSRSLQPAGQQILSEPVAEERMVPEQQKNPEDQISVSLCKYNDFILRSFEEDESPVQHVKPCKDFLEYKRRRVDEYYFGSDDDGDAKDLKKNIASSFKKFMQMQLFRSFSAVSENN